MQLHSSLCAALAVLMAGPALADPAPGEVLARAGNASFTTANLADVLAIDAAVLESPLDAGEQAQIRNIVVAQFESDPARVGQALPVIHQNAELFRHGTGFDRAAAREAYWEAVVKAAPSDRFLAQWLGLMRHHTPVLAEGDGMVVTGPELAAMFATEDDVADIGGQPRRAAAERAALAQSLAARFAGMPAAEKAQYAHAERRRAALQANIFAYDDLRAKAVGLIKAAVHKPEDVPPEARKLEADGMQFVEAFQRFAGQQAQAMQMMGKLNSVEGINFASRKFLGQGP